MMMVFETLMNWLRPLVVLWLHNFGTLVASNSGTQQKLLPEFQMGLILIAGPSPMWWTIAKLITLLTTLLQWLSALMSAALQALNCMGPMVIWSTNFCHPGRIYGMMIGALTLLAEHVLFGSSPLAFGRPAALDLLLDWKCLEQNLLRVASIRLRLRGLLRY